MFDVLEQYWIEFKQLDGYKTAMSKRLEKEEAKKKFLYSKSPAKSPRISTKEKKDHVDVNENYQENMSTSTGPAKPSSRDIVKKLGWEYRSIGYSYSDFYIINTLQTFINHIHRRFQMVSFHYSLITILIHRII